MDETTIQVGEFLRGERNAVRGDFIISREQTKKSSFCFVSMASQDEPKHILAGWAKPIKPEPLATIRKVGVEEQEVKTKKHTGGKRPYIMLMQDKAAVVKELSLGASGLMFKIIASGCIEWHTGRIIKKRSKKPMTFAMICSEFGLKSAEGKDILRELGDSGIVNYDNSKKAYFLDRTFASKGGKSK